MDSQSAIHRQKRCRTSLGNLLWASRTSRLRVRAILWLVGDLRHHAVGLWELIADLPCAGDLATTPTKAGSRRVLWSLWQRIWKRWGFIQYHVLIIGVQAKNL